MQDLSGFSYLRDRIDALANQVSFLSAQVEVLRQKTAVTLESSARKSFDEAAAAVQAEFGSRHFIEYPYPS
jgi:outer membrane murein-binding lipoprotein Lpp